MGKNPTRNPVSSSNEFLGLVCSFYRRFYFTPSCLQVLWWCALLILVFVAIVWQSSTVQSRLPAWLAELDPPHIWDIAAILLSIVLTLLIWYKLFVGEDYQDCPRWVLGVAVWCDFLTVIPLAVAGILLWHDRLGWMLALLAITTLIFLIIDFVLLWDLENQRGAAEQALSDARRCLSKSTGTKQENAEAATARAEKKVNLIRRARRGKQIDIAFGNSPAFVGFLVLLAYHWASNGAGANGFIAGGAAMHMIFGNFVIAIGLRKTIESKSENSRQSHMAMQHR